MEFSESNTPNGGGGGGRGKESRPQVSFIRSFLGSNCSAAAGETIALHPPGKKFVQFEGKFRSARRAGPCGGRRPHAGPGLGPGSAPPPPIRVTFKRPGRPPPPANRPGWVGPGRAVPSRAGSRGGREGGDHGEVEEGVGGAEAEARVPSHQRPAPCRAPSSGPVSASLRVFQVADSRLGTDVQTDS